MITILVNKVLIILLIMSCLNTLRHTYYFIQAFLQSTTEEPVKYKLNTTSLLILGISISYILTVLVTGLN